MLLKGLFSMETSPLRWVENEDISFCRYNDLVAQICRKNGGYMIYIICDSEYEKACKNRPYQNLYTGFDWVYEKAVASASKRLLEE